MSDIDTVAVDSLKALDPNRPIKKRTKLAAQRTETQLTHERRTASVEEKTCPKCAEQIKPAASVCRFCGHEFPPGEVIKI